MMKAGILCLFIIVMLLQSSPAAAVDQTHINNNCFFDIIATTTYDTSGFTDRTIPVHGIGETTWNIVLSNTLFLSLRMTGLLYLEGCCGWAREA